MKNRNMPANPLDNIAELDVAKGYDYESGGLTKLEYAAIAAMQGMLANKLYDPPRRNKAAGFALDAVLLANALFDELEQE